MLSQVLDRLIAFSARDEAALLEGRAVWDEAAGRVLDDDPLYEERTAAFLEWFVLEWRGPDGQVPARRYLAEAPRQDELEALWVEALIRSHRSLFEVRTFDDGVVLVEDLLGGGAFEVSERRRLAGVEEGDLLEARLVADVATPPLVLFTRALLFHPREAAEALRGLAVSARREREPRASALSRFQRLRLKALRYAHVPAAKIYTARDAP